MPTILDNFDLLYKLAEFGILGSGVVVAILRTGKVLQKFEGIAERQTAEITDLKVDVKDLSKVIVENIKLNGRLDLYEQRQLAEGRRLDELAKDIRQVIKNMPRLSE